MRVTANNDSGSLESLTVVAYGIVAALAFILAIGVITIARDNAGNHFEAGSEDLVIPGSLA
jgi:hypothetical protein